MRLSICFPFINRQVNYMILIGTNRQVQMTGPQKRIKTNCSKYLGQRRQVQRDRSKETDPKRRVQIDSQKSGSKQTGPRRQNGPNISKLVQYGPKSTKRTSKWVPHNEVSWSSLNELKYLKFFFFYYNQNVFPKMIDRPSD